MSTPSNGPEDGYTAPPHQLATWTILGVALVLVLGLFSLRGTHGPETSRDYPSRTLPPEPQPVLLPGPNLDSAYMPCSDCHEDEPVNRRVRELEDEHEDIALEHGNLWCLHCHTALEYDVLHLADDTPVPYEESWRLCTQCHAKKLPDWRAGVHGKRTGFWWGPKEFRTCVECHNPHSPRFKPLEPKPAPRRPELITAAGAMAEEAAHE